MTNNFDALAGKAEGADAAAEPAGGFAQFDTDAIGPVQKLQRFLHSYPTFVPLIVLAANSSRPTTCR